MSKKILFSPIGGTDPISNEKDGSLLHICRTYQPDKVYLFLSYEMYQNHLRDNRYLYCLEKLGELLGHTFETELIIKEDLVNVQEYDTFYKLFNEKIIEIKKTMETEDILYLNTSSGTPAMKSALFLIATLDNYRIYPIQVSTPKKSINPHEELRDKDYSPELYWSYNDDNCENYENRCKEVRSMNLVKYLKLDVIKNHIQAFDYKAAVELAKTIPELCDTKLMTMLDTALYRSSLDKANVDKCVAKIGWKELIPIKDGEYRKISEYAMLVWLKMERGEYADYIRSITPLVVVLYEKIFEKVSGITLEKLMKTVTKKNITKQQWNQQVIEQNYPKIKKILDEKFQNFKYGDVSSIHLAELIINMSSDTKLISEIKDMTEVEQNVRNVAAHTLVKITDNDIKIKCGKNAQEIFKMIKYFCKVAGMQVTADIWDTYLNMNEQLIQEIELA